MNYRLLSTAALLMAVAVIFGALGAHALEKHLEPDLLESFETGVRYQIYHALSLFLVSIIYTNLPRNRARLVAWLMGVGVLFFSGSIYLFVVGDLIDYPFSSLLWWLTPLGGISLICSWLVLFTTAWSHRKKKEEK